MIEADFIPLNASPMLFNLPGERLKAWASKILTQKNGTFGFDKKELYEFMLENPQQFQGAIKKIIRSGDPLLRLCATCNARPVVVVDDKRICEKCLHVDVKEKTKEEKPMGLNISKKLAETRQKAALNIVPLPTVPPEPIPISTQPDITPADVKAALESPIQSSFLKNSIANLNSLLWYFATQFEKLEGMDKVQQKILQRLDALESAAPVSRPPADSAKAEADADLAKKTSRAAMAAVEDVVTDVVAISTRLSRLEKELGVS